MRVLVSVLRRSALLTIIGVFVFGLAACGSGSTTTKSSPSPLPEVVVTKLPASITVARSQTISVKLDANPSTGFVWRVTDEAGATVVPGPAPSPGDPAEGTQAVIMRTAPTYVAGPTNEPGATGMSITTFVAQTAGSSVFNFTYGRPTTNNGATTSQLVIRVN